MESGNLHKALLHEDNLDTFFSYFDATSWKTARLVCSRWNDRLLSSLYKKHRLPLDRTSEDELAVLCSVDNRLLRSISMLCINTFEEKRTQLVFKHLKDSGNLSRIQSLGLSVDEEAFTDFIKVINDGGFKGLKKLELHAKCNDLLSDRCAVAVVSGSLPELTHFKPRFYKTSKSERGEHVLLAIQSIVSAAVNLETLDCTMPLDLSGRNVKKLYLNLSMYEFPDQYEAESSRMILSVRESLTFLKLLENIPEVLGSAFPKLKCLTVPFVSGGITPLNLRLLPDLRKITLPFDMIPWVDLPKAFLPAGKLQDIKIWMYHHEHFEFEALPAILKNLEFLLNARLSRLRFHMTGIFYPLTSIEKLLELLDAVHLREPEEVKSGVLDIIGMPADDFVDIGPGNHGFCSKILEKLGAIWSVIRFIYDGIPSEPIWNEMDVPLFEGKKTGRVRSSQSLQEDPEGHDWHILSLEIL